MAISITVFCQYWILTPDWIYFIHLTPFQNGCRYAQKIYGSSQTKVSGKRLFQYGHIRYPFKGLLEYWESRKTRSIPSPVQTLRWQNKQSLTVVCYSSKCWYLSTLYRDTVSRAFHVISILKAPAALLNNAIRYIKQLRILKKDRRPINPSTSRVLWTDLYSPIFQIDNEWNVQMPNHPSDSDKLLVSINGRLLQKRKRLIRGLHLLTYT